MTKKQEDSRITRKGFLTTAGLGVLGAGIAAAGATSCQRSNEQEAPPAPGIITNRTYRWNMVTTWPPNFPVVGEGCRMFATWVKEMSAGQLEITVYGGGELIPALEAFEAVSSRTADIGSGAAYYWAGKSQAAQFFGAVPFGLNAQQMNAWLYCGGGLKLWEETYAPFNLVPLPGGHTGVQMGGWFNRRIDGITDVKGLKMRIPGLGGKIIERAGGTAVLSAGSEIYTNLERGVIDATEWIGPYHDYLMGFHDIAKYYYYPGWHEPTALLEIFINRVSFESLPAHLREIVRTASYRLNMWMLSEFEAKNADYLRKIRTESDVQVLPFPDEVLSEFERLTKEVISEITAKDKLSARIYDSYSSFKRNVSGWSAVSERMYQMKL